MATSVIRLITVSLILLVWLSIAVAQTISRPTTSSRPDNASNTEVGSIKGRVVLENGAPVSQAVRITLVIIRGSPASLYSDNQGQFEIKGLAPGEYTLEVEGDRLVYETITERVDVRRGEQTFLNLILKEKSSDKTSKPARPIASVTELSANVPAKARAEFERANKAVKEGKTEDAIAHLRRAIEAYPDFMIAHNDLGAQLLAQGKLEEASKELRRALEIDSKAFNPHLNLGIVLFKQQRYAEAADMLRTAVAIESTSSIAHLYLGFALKNMKDFDGEEAELKLAYSSGGADFSIALFELGNLYMRRGNRALALQAFELYVRQSPNAANAAEARRLIGILR